MIKKLLQGLFFGLFVGLVATTAGAQSNPPSKPSVERLSFVEDASKGLSFAELLSPNTAWQALPLSGLAKGYTSSAFWVRAELSLPSHRAILTALPSFLDNVLFVVPESLVAPQDRYRYTNAEAAGWLQSQQGDFFPRHNRILDWRGFSLDLKPAVVNPTQLHTVFIRIETGSTSLVQVEVFAERDFQASQGAELLAFGAIIGSALVFSLIGFFFWVLYRQEPFRYYLFFALSCLVWYVSANGFLSQLIPVFPVQVSHVVGFSVCTMFGAVALLMRRLLDAKTDLPRLDAFLKFTALLQIGLAPLAFADWYRYFAQWISLIGLAQWLVMLIIIAKMFSSKRRLRFNLLSLYTGLILANTFMLLGFLFGITPANTAIQILQSITFFDLMILLPMLLISNEQAKSALLQAQSEAEVAAKKLVLEEKLREEQHKWVQMITHELRTPLTIIDAARQLLNRTATDALSADRLDKMARAVQRLTSLIDSFVLEDEVSGGHRKLNKTAIATEPLLSTLRNLLPEDTLNRLNLRVSNPLPSFQADRDLAIIALSNLVNNAARHSPQGSEIKLEVMLASEHNQQFIQFAVTNVGAPIPAADQERLFHRYYRFGNSAGTGLGLWAVCEIANAHGGRCDYREESIDTSLTTHVFRLVFPVG